MKRVMGLDLGDRTIGVAVSDPLMIMAQGLTTIRREENELEKDFKELEKIIKEYDVAKIVIGLPKNMNGSIGFQGEKTLEFGKELEEHFEMEIIYEDERLTTMAAEKLLISGNVRRENRKKVIDKVAATYILQTYIDRTGGK